MLFNDRTALGKTLAKRLQKYRGKDAVILCLKEESLLTSVTVAAELRAWVYPLLSSPIYGQDFPRRLLGAYSQDGEFCLNPDGTESSLDDFAPDTRMFIDNQKAAAIQDMKAQAEKFEMTFSKESMQGRDVIVVGDVITSVLPLVLASQLLNSGIRPKSIAVAIGNTTPAVAAAARLLAEEPIIQDVISDIVLDDEHYFEHPDAYDPEQKYALTQHIAAYWR